jgi:pyruvate, water dikinase
MKAFGNVIWLDDPASGSVGELGGKLRSLIDLKQGGFSVPHGFGVTTNAFTAAAREAGITDRIREAGDQLDPGDLTAAKSVSAELTAKLVQAAMPQAIEQEIRAAYQRLEALSNQSGVPVAIRSSGVSEDLATASFAGQYETYLWVRGADAVIEHVERCWTGVFAPEVLTYRPTEEVEGKRAAQAGISVVVQRMIDARSAGVAFTLDPISGDRAKIIVESCWGLGEGVVKGDVTPDRFKFDKVTLELVRKDVAVQALEYRFDEAIGTVAAMPVEPERGTEPSLRPEEAAAVARLAKEVERLRDGAPQDIEWALDKSREPHLLQARAETVWAGKQQADETGGKSRSAMDRVLQTFVDPGRSRQ